MVQFQGHSPCHSQLGASTFCVTTGPEGWPGGPSSHILVLEAAPAPHCHSPAICQPLATEWLVSEWLLTPDWDLSIGYHSLLGNGLFCVCKWFFPHIHRMPLYLSVPEFTEARVLPWGELGLDSVHSWFLSLPGLSAELPARTPLYLVAGFLLGMQGLLLHAACPWWQKKKGHP